MSEEERVINCLMRKEGRKGELRQGMAAVKVNCRQW
jgi:hypothetical protein